MFISSIRRFHSSGESLIFDFLFRENPGDVKFNPKWFTDGTTRFSRGRCFFLSFFRSYRNSICYIVTMSIFGPIVKHLPRLNPEPVRFGGNSSFCFFFPPSSTLFYLRHLLAALDDSSSSEPRQKIIIKTSSVLRPPAIMQYIRFRARANVSAFDAAACHPCGFESVNNTL